MASAEGNTLGTLLIAVAAALAAAFYVVDARLSTGATRRIAANERARVVARLNSVLDPALARPRPRRRLLLDVTDAELLGSDDAVDVFVLTRGAAQPVACCSRASHRTATTLRSTLLIGVSPAGAVTGVRAVRHRETPGLGDAIDAAKSDWIAQFDGKSLAAPAPAALGRRARRRRVRFDLGRDRDLARRRRGRQEHVAILRAAPRRALRARGCNGRSHDTDDDDLPE